MTDKKPTSARLKIYVFSIGGGRYESGIIVVIAGTLKAAQKQAYASFGDSTIFGISSPDSFSSYVVKPIAPGVVASHNYAM